MTHYHKIPVRRMVLFFLVSISSLISCTSERQIHILSGTKGSTYEEIVQYISNSAKLMKIPSIVNINSQGSIANLNQLLSRKTDFALMQLDVASQAMKQKQIQAIAVLGDEHLHIIVRRNSHIKSLFDLKGTNVADGTGGSGNQFTTKRLLKASDISVHEVPASLDESFKQLLEKKVDAVFYVGPLGTNETVKVYLHQHPDLQLLSLQPSLINFLTAQFPESYHAEIIPVGTYSVLPVQPQQNIVTITTSTALVTRPDVDKDQVALIAWAIIATSRQYTQFYPQLSVGDDKVLMHKGLFYIHPGAQLAFQQGDPRIVWLNYLNQNKHLQTAIITVSLTSLSGYLWRRWQKQRAAELIQSTRLAIHELRATMIDNPQKTWDDLENLHQQQRFKLIEGAISWEIYDQIERMIHIFAEECRKLREQQRQSAIQNTLLLLEDPQAESLDSMTSAKINQTEAHYRQMLLSGQIDIHTYLLLKQLAKKS